jgi:hypothetical protein
VLPAVFGVRRDEGTEQFLSAAGATEQFNDAKGEKLSGGESQVSPLVKEAEAFALYLNPPKPKTPPRQAARERGISTPRPAVVSAKFNLIGTSYYALRPELSLALIDEPGKGFHWVRQAGKVGHLIIEKVEDGLVVVRDGQRTFELEVDKPKKRSLVKGSISDVRITSTELPPMSRDEEEVSGKQLNEAEQSRTGGGLGELEDNLMAAMEVARADGNVEEVGKLEKLISDIETMRIGDEEARQLGRLGERLRERHRRIHRARDGKIEADANLSEPNLAVPGANDVNWAEANSPE